ncbi:MAG: signal recognition particle-docking protein FtsY [Armatimonadetes bacterium]|nr:signal recognition particle-docking protein FtsY [Armatimonadota bacterium]
MRFGFVKSILQRVDTLITGRGRIDEELFEDLEALLLQADVNVATTTAALDALRTEVRESRIASQEDVRSTLRVALTQVMERSSRQGAPLAQAENKPTLYLVVGVNGVGKTTTIAKIARRIRADGRSVMMAAGDTFRAAAIDQLEIWADRVGASVLKHREGSDPSAVVFDSIRAARNRGIDTVIADTAGRLHTKDNLMEELRKVVRVAERELGRPPDETLLVLDATTGQNGLNQAKQFRDAVGITGIVLTKLDGTARGGIVLTIADEVGVPIRLVGTGEKSEDLEDFEAGAFIEALLR